MPQTSTVCPSPVVGVVLGHCLTLVGSHVSFGEKSCDRQVVPQMGQEQGANSQPGAQGRQGSSGPGLSLCDLAGATPLLQGHGKVNGVEFPSGPQSHYLHLSNGPRAWRAPVGWLRMVSTYHLVSLCLLLAM